MRPRMHSRHDPVVDHLTRDRPVEYNDENFVTLVGLAHFHSAQLTPVQQERARRLLDEWELLRAQGA